MRVTNQARWRRTKITAAGVLLAIAMLSAGGGDDTMTVVPMPSAVMFITAIGLLTWLTINIIKPGR